MSNPTNEKSQPAQEEHDVSGGDASPPVENHKVLASTSWFTPIAWHFWTIGPCLVTAVLLALNFSRYVFGTYVGKNLDSTSDIIAILQVSAKIHEVWMLIGLANIVQQAIQRSLTKHGLLLGLLGAELSLGNILFTMSREFRAAFRYGIHNWRQQKKIFLLVALIFVVCLLSVVVGPASAVLMVPEVGWFLEKRFAWYTADIFQNSNFSPIGALCYPYILIDPRLGGGSNYTNDVGYNTPFYQPIPDYWEYSMFARNHSDVGVGTEENRQVRHQFLDQGLVVTVNSSTSWSRTLDIDSDWKGETNFTTAVQWDTDDILQSLINYQPVQKNAGSQVHFVADTTGIDSSTVCRRRHKLFCNSSSIMTGNSSDWCFKSVASDNDEGPLLQGQDLLLLTDANRTEYKNTTRFWITEGLRTSPNNKFTDSIVFVLEDNHNSTFLIVCSTSTTLDSVTATSDTKQFNAQQVSPHEDLYYFKPKDQTALVPPQALLYHENWLDMIYLDLPEKSPDYPPQLINKTYPQRNASQVTANPALNAWALGIQDAQSTAGGSVQSEDASGAEAGMVEIVLGGAFITMLSRMVPSYIQYSVPDEWYFNSTSDIMVGVYYPPELMPEGIIDCQYINKTLDVYHLVYGYNGKSTGRILSMLVLLLHCFVVILGSLWQCRRGRVINAWSSIPEYATLCLGTDPQLGAIENTSVRIKSKKTLQTLVKVTGGGVGQQENHFELVKVQPGEGGSSGR